MKDVGPSHVTPEVDARGYPQLSRESLHGRHVRATAKNHESGGSPGQRGEGPQGTTQILVPIDCTYPQHCHIHPRRLYAQESRVHRIGYDGRFRVGTHRKHKVPCKPGLRNKWSVLRIVLRSSRIRTAEVPPQVRIVDLQAPHYSLHRSQGSADAGRQPQARTRSPCHARGRDRILHRAKQRIRRCALASRDETGRCDLARTSEETRTIPRHAPRVVCALHPPYE